LQRLKALADTFNALGGVYREAEMLDQATAMFSQAVTRREQLVSQDPANDEFQRLLANARMNLGQIELQLENVDKARELMLAAQTMRRSLVDKNPKARRDLAMGYYNLGNLAVADQKDSEAVKYFRDAIGQFEQLLEKDPRSLANRYLIAVCYRQLGNLQVNANDIGSALLNFEIARLGMEKLAIGNPDVVFYQSELANLTVTMADLYDAQDDLPKAHRAWTQVLLIVQELLRSDPNNSEFRRHEAASLGAIGNIQLRSGEAKAATEMLTTARDRLKQLLTEFPEDENLKEQLKDTLADLAAAAAPPLEHK
jgi:tetratricopeptide (TPR) repeat protein